MAERLTELSCHRFSDCLASGDPVPGGGGSAALIGSLAASLGAMAARLTLGKMNYLSYEKDHQRIISELDLLRLRFLDLVNKDAAMFEPLSRVYSMRRDTPGYAEQFRAAVLDACRPPLEMMQCCTALIDLLSELNGKCSALMLSDLGCSALSARAALESAAMNVFVNTRCLHGDPEAHSIAEQAEEILRQYTVRAQSIADSVMIYLKD